MTNVISLEQMRAARRASTESKMAIPAMDTHLLQQPDAAMTGIRAGLDLAHIAARSRTNPSQVDAQLYLEHIFRAASAARELIGATADDTAREALESVCATMEMACPEHVPVVGAD